MNESNELVKLLSKTKADLQQDFSVKAIENIKTSEIQTQIRRFKTSTVNPLVDDIDRVTEIIKSPIHVGMLGRYSHGKSALVNALFDLDEDCKLPEGEGVVTSKVTHVCFDKQLYSPEVYAQKKTGESQSIDISELRNCVGRTTKDTSTIDYYKMYLPTDGKGFATLFAQKNINLVDMPGLGGPYFNDQVQTKRYIKELDMIIAVIKMDDICQSGIHINHLIEASGIPVIPVLTFADIWNQSDLYSDCDDLAAAIEKARNLVKENIPSLIPNINNLIAVSAYTGHNINELQTLILNNINAANISIGKAKKDISPVYKKQLKEFKEAYSQLKDKLKGMCSDLEEILKPIIPLIPEQQKSCYDDAVKQNRVKRAEQNLRDEANRSINDLFARYKDRLAQIDTIVDYKLLIPEADKIVKDTNARIIRESTERTDSFFHTYKDELYYALSKQIDEMSLDAKTKRNLEQETSRLLEEKNIDFENRICIKPDSDKIAKICFDYTKKISINLFTSMVKHPEALIVTIIGIILCSIFKLFNWNWIILIGIGFIGFGIIICLLEQGGDKKRFFYDLKKDVISYLTGIFDSNEKKDALSAAIDKALLEIKEDVSDALSDDTASYNADASFLSHIKDNVEETIESLSSKLEDELCGISAARR